MLIKPIKTSLVKPNDDLFQIITSSIKSIEENSILAVTSKIVSICEGRLVPMDSIAHDELVKKEADKYLDRNLTPQGLMMHTIKNNLLIGSAGIDRSKALKSYILWPENPKQTAESICKKLKGHFQVKNLGIIITDSHSIPTRRGVIGFSLAYFGFAPIKDYRIVQSNIADGLAAAAVATMGEGNELTPLSLISDISFVEFGDNFPTGLPNSSFEVPEDEDLFSPFFKNSPWQKG